MPPDLRTGSFDPHPRGVILLNSVWLGIDSTINRRALLFDAAPSSAHGIPQVKCDKHRIHT